MSNFIISGIYSLYHSFRHKFWPNEALKRRRDSSDEDRDDVILAGCPTPSKRPRWMDNPNMAFNNDGRVSASSSKSHLSKTVQENVQPRLKNMAAKENGNDVEVIVIEDDEHLPVESRAPLASLSVRAKSKSDPVDVVYSINGHGSINQRSVQKNGVHNTERRKNGIHPILFQSSFTTPLRFSKYSSTPKQTALNETLKVDDQRKYSALLADYHTSVKVSKTQENHLSRQNSTVENTLKTMSPSCSKSIDSLDTRHKGMKHTRVPVKPWQSSASDDDIEIIEERSCPRVNSLEKKLAQNSLVSPQWILDMQKKYNEREREARRQVEEAELKKELYAQHNYTKRLEALDERIRKHLRITDVVLEDVEEVPELPELTSEMNKRIDSALKQNPPSEVLVEGFGQLIRRLDIKTLHHLNWLNDEVINFYMNLIVERGEKGGKIPKVYAFNTFFYPKLVSHGFNSLKRWTKKVDIFAQELLLVPIHLGMHWCMAAIDFRDRSVRYYDSMGSENNRCLNALLRYLSEESIDKKKIAHDTSGWKTENVKGIPQQMNGSDCGMFSCMFAEYLSRNAKFTFSQKDMPYFRRKMVYEIISKSLLQ